MVLKHTKHRCMLYLRPIATLGVDFINILQMPKKKGLGEQVSYATIFQGRGIRRQNQALRTLSSICFFSPR